MQRDSRRAFLSGLGRVLSGAAGLLGFQSAARSHNSFPDGTDTSISGGDVTAIDATLTARLAQEAQGLGGDQVSLFAGLKARDVTARVSTMAALRALPLPQLALGRTVLLIVAGYNVEGDRGGGIFRWQGNSNQADDGGVVIRPTAATDAGRWLRVLQAPPTACAFGADDSGATYSDEAFAAYRAWVVSQSAALATTNARGNRGNATFELPPGHFKLRTNKALLGDTGVSVIQGLAVKGAGMGVTKVTYEPTGSGFVLLDNTDDWFYLDIEDIEFNCNNNTAICYRSAGSGTASVRWQRVKFGGIWAHHVKPEGGDLNSEHSFDKCNFDIDLPAGNYAFYIPATATDQLVNYSFVDCEVYCRAGGFIRADKGGSIYAQGGSWTLNAACADYFLRFPVGDHNSGAQKLAVRDVRMELKRSAAAPLTGGVIECEWKTGTVLFEGVHDDVTAFADDLGRQSHRYGWVNADGPIITYRDCNLSYKHGYYAAGTNTSVHKCIIRYEGCSLGPVDDARDFFITPTTDLGLNTAGLPAIDVVGCRPSQVTIGTISQYKFDQVVNWDQSSSAEPRLRVARFVDPTNRGLPKAADGALFITLPKGAMIRSVGWYKEPDAGGYITTEYIYTVKTTDGAPVTLATFDGATASTQWSAGFDRVDTISPRFKCSTVARQRLQLVNTGIGVNLTPGAGYVFVEYWA